MDKPDISQQRVPLFNGRLNGLKRNQILTRFGGAKSPLHHEIARRLIERLQEIKLEFKAPLIYGHRPHDCFDALKAQNPLLAHKTIMADIAPALLQDLPNDQIKALCEASDLPFANESFDLYISNLVLHWCDDLPGALIQAARVLKPNGLLLVSIIGGHSLSPLREALLRAETELTDRTSLHIAPMVDVPDAGRLLSRAGLALPMADRDHVKMEASNFIDMLKSIRNMGESNRMMAMAKTIPPRALFPLAAHHWQSITGQDPNQPIQYDLDIIYMMGWKPDNSQPQPLKRGTGQVSLKDIL